jgi:hypothetical protein
MKRAAAPSLDLIETRQRLVAMRSFYSDNRQITTMINRLIGRLAHLNEPGNKRHEDYLRKLVADTVTNVEQIALQRAFKSWTPQDDEQLRIMVDAKLPANEIAARLGRPISSLVTRGYTIGLPLKWFKQKAGELPASE